MGRLEFEKALEEVKSLPAQPPDILLELYGLYKQAAEGDVRGKRPGIFDIKGRAKFDAWTSRKGLGQEAAMDAYVSLVARLIEMNK